MANRTPLMAGNWKMNLDHVEATGVVQKLAWSLTDAKYDASKSEAAVIVPFTDLRTVQTLVEGDKLPITYGAQDISAHASGAYTGEISAAMLARLGVSYVVVGHSERREYHAEDDALVSAKAKAALGADLTPIICVGEGLDVRKAGEQVPYTLAQVTGAFEGIDAEQAARCVVAYEPVWAIGTGRTATPEQAQEMHAFIRRVFAERGSAETADALRILYGGSVNPGNCQELIGCPHIDGLFIGRSAWTVEGYLDILARCAATIGERK